MYLELTNAVSVALRSSHFVVVAFGFYVFDVFRSFSIAFISLFAKVLVLFSCYSI